MNTTGFIRLAAAMFLASSTMLIAGCGDKAPAEKTTAQTIDATRNMRFCEVLVVKVGGVEVYNTTGVSDCPDPLWNALDTEKLKKQEDALKVEKNGPHFWMMDTETVLFGEKKSFGGIETRWVATLPLLTVLKAATGAKPYTVFKPKKTQKMVYAKDKPVYELIDPEGHVYVLQAREARFSIESLAKLGEQFKELPQGWQFRARTLTEDLVLDLKPDVPIEAVGDEFHQYWTRIPANR